MFKSLSAMLFAAVLFCSQNVYAKSEFYDIDPSHTSILFLINHLGLSKMIGEFNEYQSTLQLDEEKPESSSIKISIDPKSVDTGSKALNEKLQNKDFFESDTYKTIDFVSTNIKRTSDKKSKVTGNLTMHGVTKPITLDVTFNKKATFMGQTRAGFTLRGKLKRSDFGMHFGIPDVGDEVEIYIECEAVLRDVTPTKEKAEAKH